MTIFEYLYRDASNYKAWGQILLSGPVSEQDNDNLIRCLESGQFFVAEQVGLPPLFQDVWRLNGGPTADDHGWHEFVELRPATADEVQDDLPVWGTAAELLTKFQSIKSKMAKIDSLARLTGSRPASQQQTQQLSAKY
jgi:hypothetical protein